MWYAHMDVTSTRHMWFEKFQIVVSTQMWFSICMGIIMHLIQQVMRLVNQISAKCFTEKCFCKPHNKLFFLFTIKSLKATFSV